MTIRDLNAWLETETSTNWDKMVKPPQRRPDTRPRRHILPAEFDRMLAQCGGRRDTRDRALLLVAYRHGLRRNELCALQWAQIDATSRTLAVKRSKDGIAATHPIQQDTWRALQRLPRHGAYVFTGHDGAPLSPRAVHHVLARLSRAAGLPFTVNPHMMRHGCGYALANRGVPTRTIQLYLGHRSIQSTARYTALDASAFRDLWG